MNEWKNFLFIKLPVSLLGVLLFAEALTWALSGVSLSRHDADILVSAIENNRKDSEFLIFGDSVTQDTLKWHYPIENTKLANLTTNKASGLVSVLFLLKRYLLKNDPPKTIVLASTPEFIEYVPMGKAMETYLSSVFTNGFEKEYLGKYSEEPSKKRRLAILDFQFGIVDKLLSLLTSFRQKGFREGTFEKDISVSIPPRTQVLNKVHLDINNRKKIEINLPVQNKEIIKDICQVANHHKLKVVYVAAPIPISVVKAWKEKGIYDETIKQIGQTFERTCLDFELVDINSRLEFPDHAMRDADHLIRPEWTRVYSRQLSELLEQLH